MAWIYSGKKENSLRVMSTPTEFPKMLPFLFFKLKYDFFCDRMMKLHANGVKKKEVNSTVQQLIHLKITLLEMGERAVGQKDREHDIQ